MSPLKLLFLVNGSETSAIGRRAQAFAQRLPQEWTIHLQYRPIAKWQGFFSFLQAAWQIRPDILYVMDIAYTGVLTGCLIKSLSGCSLVVDTGDVTYELARSKGVYSPPQLAAIQWVEHLALENADQIVVRGSYHQNFLAQQGRGNVVFIPDGIDMADIHPVEAIALRQELGLGTNLVVGVVGTMSWSEKHRMCYGWDIVEAIGLLPDLPIKALLIGDGNGRPYLEQRVRELGIGDRVVFTGTVSYDQLPLYLSAIDVCVSTQSNNLVGQVRTTGKLPLYLAYGKYVIATDVGEAHRILPGIGCLLPYEGIRDDRHPARLAAHLKTLLAEPDRLQAAASAPQVARENFDYAMLTQQVETLCQTLRGYPSNRSLTHAN